MEFDIVNIQDENLLKIMIGIDIMGNPCLRTGITNHIQLINDPTRPKPFFSYLIDKKQAKKLGEQLLEFSNN